ncbi:MAG TPA: PilN domain-containing protein [Fimbriimonadales bacterium]|nr:PilN domain-containing protein [Fimbriimonadales bacterium]
MPSINLIAEQRQIKRDAERRVRKWMSASGAVFVFGGLIFGFFWFQTQRAHSELRDLKAQEERLVPIKEQLALASQALKELEPRLRTLERARQATQQWNRVLEHISYVMPENTWLTNLRSTPSKDDKPVEIQYTGMSASQDLIGELMLRLQKCPDLTDVSLKYTDQRRTSQGLGLEYQIVSLLANSGTTAENKTQATNSNPGATS